MNVRVCVYVCVCNSVRACMCAYLTHGNRTFHMGAHKQCIKLIRVHLISLHMSTKHQVITVICHVLPEVRQRSKSAKLLLNMHAPVNQPSRKVRHFFI